MLRHVAWGGGETLNSFCSFVNFRPDDFSVLNTRRRKCIIWCSMFICFVTLQFPGKGTGAASHNRLCSMCSRTSVFRPGPERSVDCKDQFAVSQTRAGFSNQPSGNDCCPKTPGTLPIRFPQMCTVRRTSGLYPRLRETVR